MIRFRRGSSPDPDYVLLDGEPGWDSTNKIFKVGDGASSWDALPQIGGVSDEAVVAAVEEYLEANPSSVTPQDVENAIAAHRAEITPHPAYDTDIQSLSVLFENGLV